MNRRDRQLERQSKKLWREGQRALASDKQRGVEAQGAVSKFQSYKIRAIKEHKSSIPNYTAPVQTQSSEQNFARIVQAVNNISRINTGELKIATLNAKTQKIS